MTYLPHRAAGALLFVQRQFLLCTRMALLGGLGSRGCLGQVWCTTSSTLWCPQHSEPKRGDCETGKKGCVNSQQSCFAMKYTALLQWKHSNFYQQGRAAFWHLPQASSWRMGRGEKVSVRILLRESQDRTFLDHFRPRGKEMLLRRLCRLSAAHRLCQRSDGFPYSTPWTHACNTLQV